MAFKYTRAYLRPDLDTQFYVTPQELIDFIKESQNKSFKVEKIFDNFLV